MARLGRTKFVEEDEIFTNEIFLSMDLNENFILETFNNIETACNFLVRSGLIKNNFFCNICNSNRPIKLVKRARLIDGYV
jgi:hypothetical protein